MMKWRHGVLCIAGGWLTICGIALAAASGDFDGDGDVDAADFAVMDGCLSGSAIPASASLQCQETDLDFDTDVDLDDFAVFQRCISGENQPADPVCASHSVYIADATLHVSGTGADSVVVLRLRAGLPAILDIDLGNDGSADFSFVRALFDHIVVNTGGGDDVIWIDEVNGVFTDTEMTAVNGGSGGDQFFGGSGGEAFTGGPGNDTAYLGSGHDYVDWNPGDDTDFIEGGDGIDTIEVNGENGDEAFTVTANGTRVRFDQLTPDAFFLDIGTTEYLVLNARGGNDTLACTGNLASLIQITVDGGTGDDTLLGSNGGDVIFGGADSDFVDGQQGNDVILLEAGDDVLQWDPGDGSDLVEGGAGTDTLVFNGSNGAEIIDASADGPRLRFTRNLGNIIMDLDDVEKVDFRALGGADSITVNDLSSTDVTQVDLHLAGTLGGTTGDAQPDSVLINATGGDDDLLVTGAGTAVSVSGLYAFVNVTTTEVANDRVTVNALGGEDTVDASGLAAGVTALTLSGGVGDDLLIGSGGVDLLIGNENDDIVSGGGGDDTAQLGPGNDHFVWNPGDDTDVIDGDEDTDTVEVNGGNGAEDFTVTANGTRVRFDRIDPAPFFLDIGTTEHLVLNANGGNDTLACTGNLAPLIQITADGGTGDDTLLGSNGPDVLIGGDNNDFVDGQQNNDLALLGAGDDVFQWDPGDGNDTVEGKAGADTLVFNGSGGAEIIDLSTNGPRLRFTRNIGNVVMDLDDVEQVDYQALGGADSVVVNSLAGTDVSQVNIDLAGMLGGFAGDAQVDAITINGTGAADMINLTANAGAVLVSGLAASVRIEHAEPANDTLTVNGLGGVDTITPGPGVAILIMLTINQ